MTKKTSNIALLIVTVLLAGVFALPLLAPGMFFMFFASDSSVASCSPNSTLEGGFSAPGEFGQGTFTLDEDQVGYVATLTSVASEMEVPLRGMTIALMTALRESTLQNLANVNVPESLELPHDGVGADHDSVGIVQQRGNWGSVSDRLTIEYAWRAFFGGPEGPNGGTPAGLLDIPGWEQMGLGEAAQAVQVSAYPDGFTGWEETATSILRTLTAGCSHLGAGYGDVSADGWTRPTEGSIGSGYGPRGTICANGMCSPGTHNGVDIVNGYGTPIVAAAAGTVTMSGYAYMGGNQIIINHGGGIQTLYAHMQQLVAQVGQTVQPGEVIGYMGATGLATGSHLHYTVYVDGSTVDPVPFMAARGVDLSS